MRTWHIGIRALTIIMWICSYVCKMILVKEEQEAWGLHGKHEEEEAASLGVFSSNSSGFEGRGGVVGLLLQHVEVLLFSFCFVVCMWEWGLEREVRLVGFCEWEEGLTSGARRGKGWITHHPAHYRCHCVLSDCPTCSIIPSNKVMCFEDLSVLSRSSQTIRQVRSNYLTKFDGA